MEASICEQFSISPFDIRREKLADFCRLVDRVIKRNKYEKSKYKNGKLRVPAGDNWF